MPSSPGKRGRKKWRKKERNEWMNEWRKEGRLLSFFLPSFLPSFLHFFLSSFLSFFLSSFLSSFLPFFLHFFLSSFLPFFLHFFLLDPEVAYPSFSVCFLSFDQLSFSSYRPIKAFPHPTSLERKLDVEEKRVIYAYNWWKRRPLRKIWLWNDLTFTDVTSACQASIIDCCTGS